MLKQKKINIIIGSIMLIINFLWTAEFIYLFYGYHFTGKLWLYMYPDWVLILNLIIGLIGIFLSVYLIISKIGIKKALIIDIPILIIGLLISYIISM